MAAWRLYRRGVRILFISATRLGDAVLSTGLLAHLLAQHPGARVTVACGPVAAGVFARVPGLERVLVVEKRVADLHWLALWARVAGQKWDLVVDLRGSALSFFLGARRRIVMRGGRRPGHRLTHIARAAGLDVVPRPVAWMSVADRAAAASLLGEGRLVGLGPTANWAQKTWPPERFVGLAHALTALLPGARVAVFGGPGEAERTAASPVLAALPDAIDLVGRLSLPEAAACLARCTVFVGNDSGLMHLAAASGAATLGLFGPTPAAEYAPSGRCAAFVEASGPPGAAPMQALSLERVAEGALAVLRRDGVLPAPAEAPVA